MNDHRLQQMISRWRDGAIESEDFHALQLALKESVDARSIYLDYTSVEAELYRLASREHLQMRESALESGEVNPADDSNFLENAGFESLCELSEKSKPIIPRAFASLAMAAGLLLALVLWQGASLWKQELPQKLAVAEETVAEETARKDGSPILAEVKPVSDDCQWYVENEHRTQADSYRSGDIIRVTNGKLNLHYPNGTTVMLHSPSVYQLISRENARILVGRLTAVVTEAGIGFSVITPQATVVDLGTEFGIEVNDYGATDVVVFKGEVDVDYHNDLEGRVSAQRLRMGEAVHLNATGTTSRIVSITDSTYSDRSSQEALRPMVIAEVRDNISKRTESLSYYEIVRAGMGEDVLAYVDRLGHQYNGVTREGMPSYLIGGDYVKMFNNDKINHDIQIRVKLAVPARLYVLIDDRLTLPKWLRDNFRDTGDNIGIDRDIIGVDRGHSFPGGRWQEVRTPLGVGPGASVEDTLSVWVREVPDAGIVALGGTEDQKEGVEHYKDGSNMYGIVAVPLEGANR